MKKISDGHLCYHGTAGTAQKNREMDPESTLAVSERNSCIGNE